MALQILPNTCSRRAASWVAVAVTTVSLSAAGYTTFRLVREYGCAGALRYVWEGDPHPIHIREYIAVLNMAERSLQCNEETLKKLEKAWEISSSEGGVVATGNERFLLKSQQDIRKNMAQLSHELDEIASQLDRPVADEHLRVRKKLLSRRVVCLMERTDVLIGFYDASALKSSLSR